VAGLETGLGGGGEGEAEKKRGESSHPIRMPRSDGVVNSCAKY